MTNNPRRDSKWNCFFKTMSKCAPSFDEINQAAEWSVLAEQENLKVLKYTRLCTDYAFYHSRHATPFVYSYWVEKDIEPQIKKFHSGNNYIN